MNISYETNPHLRVDFLELFRKDPRFVAENLSKRDTKYMELVNKASKLDQKWREMTQDIQQSRAELNKVNRDIMVDHSDEKLRDRATQLKKNMVQLEHDYRSLSSEREASLAVLPNLVANDPPIGTSEDQNRTISIEGNFKVFIKNKADFLRQITGFDSNLCIQFVKTIPLHHYEITINYGLAEYDIAAEIAGSRSYFRKGAMVLLEMATALYLTEKMRSKGFHLLVPPFVVNKWVEADSTYFDAFEEMIFKLNAEERYLIPTSEHPIAAMNFGRIFAKDDLPARFCGYSTCFRKEAGAHGKDTKGLFRVHQFEKVEQFSITTPENSINELNYLVSNAEEILREFHIPFRKVLICTGEMDKKAAIHIDLEAWFPGQSKFRELGSFGNVTDWQSRRLRIKFMDNKEKIHAHTIYGTAAPIQRFILAYLENNVKENGMIPIPDKLQKYLSLSEITPSNN